MSIKNYIMKKFNELESYNKILMIILTALIIFNAILLCMNITVKLYNKKNANDINEIVVTVEIKDDSPVAETTVDIETYPETVETITDVETDTLEEKYSSVFEWQKYGGDFGIDQLYYLNELCEIYDIPIEIMLSIACTESSFCSNAKSNTSSASGYFQIIKSTAEWMYEDHLHYGTYDTTVHTSSMTKDWRLNMEIACKLMNHLYMYNNQSWDQAICRYHGHTNESVNIAYLNLINNTMIELFDMTTSNFN